MVAAIRDNICGLTKGVESLSTDREKVDKFLEDYVITSFSVVNNLQAFIEEFDIKNRVDYNRYITLVKEELLFWPKKDNSIFYIPEDTTTIAMLIKYDEIGEKRMLEHETENKIEKIDVQVDVIKVELDKDELIWKYNIGDMIMGKNLVFGLPYKLPFDKRTQHNYIKSGPNRIIVEKDKMIKIKDEERKEQADYMEYHDGVVVFKRKKPDQDQHKNNNRSLRDEGYTLCPHCCLFEYHPKNKIERIALSEQFILPVLKHHELHGLAYDSLDCARPKCNGKTPVEINVYEIIQFAGTINS